MQKNVIILPDNSRPYDPEEKPHWWNENDYYEYHWNKGHKTGNYIKLKHTIQDLIESRDVVVDGHNVNTGHKAFKEPFPKYEIEEVSKSKNTSKVNYMFSNNNNVIHMVEPIEEKYCNMTILKGPK